MQWNSSSKIRSMRRASRKQIWRYLARTSEVIRIIPFERLKTLQNKVLVPHISPNKVCLHDLPKKDRFFLNCSPTDLGRVCGGSLHCSVSGSHCAERSECSGALERFFDVVRGANKCPARKNGGPAFLNKHRKTEAREGFWYDHGEIAQQVMLRTERVFSSDAFRVVQRTLETVGILPSCRPGVAPDLVGILWSCGPC